MSRLSRWIALAKRPNSFASGAALLLLVAGAAMTLPRLLADEQFPHEQHANLFPVCTGCHVGVEENDSARFYPAAATCAGCHDGLREQRVTYSPPRPGGPSMLDFDHVEHFTEAAQEDLACEDCHTRAGDSRMAVRYASARRCLACHEHQSPEHITVAQCVECHVPFAESGLEPTLALALPVPDPHREPGFIERIHADSARARPERCATCHVRERCEACHVNAADNAVIASIPALGTGPGGTRLVALPDTAARYPEPPSHRDPDWLKEHGFDARATPADCATCHTRQSCETCHRGPVRQVVNLMPDARTTSAPGVTTERLAPESHRTPEFRRRHGNVATTQSASCTTCHVRVECEACHNAPDRMPYHPANFESRHPAAAYGRELECSSCHSTERFCRDCHAQLGMRSQGRLGSGFHDAQPLWLLRHGQAARQTLESCTTCHEQRDCMQCHSQTGSFQINPHGPDFDAERARDRNSRICFACHVADPIGDE